MFTTFILDDIGKKNGEKGVSKFSFDYKFNEFWSVDKDTPEAAIAYSHLFWFEELKRLGFQIVEPVELGHWRYSKTYTLGHGQDVFVVAKNNSV